MKWMPLTDVAFLGILNPTEVYTHQVLCTMGSNSGLTTTGFTSYLAAIPFPKPDRWIAGQPGYYGYRYMSPLFQALRKAANVTQIYISTIAARNPALRPKLRRLDADFAVPVSDEQAFIRAILLWLPMDLTDASKMKRPKKKSQPRRKRSGKAQVEVVLDTS